MNFSLPLAVSAPDALLEPDIELQLEPALEHDPPAEVADASPVAIAPLPAVRHDVPASPDEALAMMERYVWQLARKLSGGRDIRDDLYNDGLFAVVKALATFRNDRGCGFKSYAWSLARWSMIAVIKRERPWYKNTVSGDAPLFEDVDSITLLDAIPAKVSFMESPYGRISVSQLRDAVSKLPEKERRYVRLMLCDLNIPQIAAHLGVSKQRASQVLADAFARLRKRMTYGLTVEPTPVRPEDVMAEDDFPPADRPQDQEQPSNAPAPEDSAGTDSDYGEDSLDDAEICPDFSAFLEPVEPTNKLQ